MSINLKFPMLPGIHLWIPYSKWRDLQRKMLYYNDESTGLNIVLGTTSASLGVFTHPSKLHLLQLKEIWPGISSQYDLPAFHLGVNTLCDLCWSPIAVVHYPKSHWFKSILEPHNSFGLSLGSATSKIFLFNLLFIPFKETNWCQNSISAS